MREGKLVRLAQWLEGFSHPTEQPYIPQRATLCAHRTSTSGPLPEWPLQENDLHVGKYTDVLVMEVDGTGVTNLTRTRQEGGYGQTVYARSGILFEEVQKGK